MDSVASEFPIKLAAETLSSGAACATVTLRPAMVSVARREPAFGFLEMANLTVPTPLPFAPEAIVINGSLLTAVHAQPSLAFTLTTPLPPSEGKAKLVRDTMKTQSTVLTVRTKT